MAKNTLRSKGSDRDPSTRGRELASELASELAYHHRFLLVQNCTHHHQEYYCCPPYTSPGGIRSFLFHNHNNNDDEQQQQQQQQDSSAFHFHWPLPLPLPLNLHSLTLIAPDRKILTARILSNLIGDKNSYRYNPVELNWDSLGDSHCFRASLSHRYRHHIYKRQYQRRKLQSKSGTNTNTNYENRNRNHIPARREKRVRVHKLRRDNHKHHYCHRHYQCNKTIHPAVLQNIITSIQSSITPELALNIMVSENNNEAPSLSTLLSFIAFDDGNDNHDGHHGHGHGHGHGHNPQASSAEKLHKHTHKHTLNAPTSISLDRSLSPDLESEQSQSHSHSHSPSSHAQESERTVVLEEATIVYHESARSIVFRDHLRKVHEAQQDNSAISTITPHELRKYRTTNHTNTASGSGSGASARARARSRSKSNVSHASFMSDVTIDSTTCGSMGARTAKSRSSGHGHGQGVGQGVGQGQAGNSTPTARKNAFSSRSPTKATSMSTDTASSIKEQDDGDDDYDDNIASGSVSQSQSNTNATNASKMRRSQCQEQSTSTSAGIGATSHAVHGGSVASIASSLDGAQQQQQQQHVQQPDVHSVDHHSVSTVDYSDGHRIPNNGNGYIRDRSDSKPQVIIANYMPEIDPLPPLDLGPHNEFSDLLLSNPYVWREGQGPEEAVRDEDVWETLSDAEREVVDRLLHQRAAVKTIKKSDVTSFLSKFPVKGGEKARRWFHPIDFQSATKIEKINGYRDAEGQQEVHSFFTSLSLLPAYGLKMRSYGSTREYPLGMVFAMPDDFPKDVNEDKAAERNHAWSWPAGYAAKTEFNIARNGELINGRKEALVPISQLRKMNHAYIYDRDYEVLGKLIKGGFKTLPYNEIFCRVGGVGRIQKDDGGKRSFDDGLGLPVAIFARTATFGDLTALLRLRARLGSVIGKEYVRGIPLLLIDPDIGTRVLSEKMQQKLLTTMSNSLNPFQNPLLQHKTRINQISEPHLQQKLEELLDLDDDNIRDILTSEECARLAGGYGATDESVARLLMDAMLEDHETEGKNGERLSDGIYNTNKLQNIVNEGLTSAVRSGDFNTSRQLLILYTLVASRCKQETERESSHKGGGVEGSVPSSPKRTVRRLTSQISSMSNHSEMESTSIQRKQSSLSPPPPPPPLDTDRLRSATNSDGLLAVLGAAEVLKSLQTGAASKRVLEAALAIEEWIEKSEHSVAFRLASWRDLTAAQDDLKIATEGNSNFMAFISNKAITNRKRFAKQLRHSVENADFESIEFLKEIHAILLTMHSPCLRLELLQFILGLDNRYSVAHVARSVELAATCLNISASEDIFAKDD